MRESVGGGSEGSQCGDLGYLWNPLRSRETATGHGENHDGRHGERGYPRPQAARRGDSEVTARYLAVTLEVTARYLAVISEMTISAQLAAAGITGALRVFTEGRRWNSEVTARYLAVISKVTARYLAATSEMSISA